MTSLIDPYCRGGVHRGCEGGPCECPCHEPPRTLVRPETVAQMAAVLAFIVDRHRPDVFSAATQGMTCQACSLLAGIPIGWPCPDREAAGDLLPDHSNRLLPGADLEATP